MKSSLRIASAALALTLAAGMALPAAAASKPAFSKDETVYAVLEADGSIRSTTVSEHLYHAGGLSSVTDRTTLTDIVNTESDAAFTQNGESLVWNTSDTDVYYKGNTDKQLPLAAAVTYTLDGVEKPLEELLGQSGHLVVTVQLTNQTAETLTVDGKERTIVTPFVTAVGVLLGQEATNVSAAHGLLESAAKSSVAAFVTLPGVREALDGLLPSGVSALEDYLQDTVTVEADVENLTAPQILIASAASAEALGQGDVFDFGDVSALTDGITQLNDAMQQLLSGAAQLVDGAGQLASGSVQLLDGANQLDSGLGQLVEGLDTLTANNAALTAGAQQVADGVLDSASKSLMENGLIDAPMTWDNYNTVLDEVLQLGERTLAAGRKKMVRTIQAQAPQFKAGWLDLALYLSATRTDSDLEAALRLIQNFSPSVLVGWLQKVTDPNAQQVIHDELVLQTEQSDDIASVRELKENLNSIQFFVSSVGRYADGVAAAAEGAHAAKEGSAQLTGGAQALYEGANQLLGGTVQLSSGLNQFNTEGISQLTGALDTDQLHALQAVLDAMVQRMQDYDGFAGTPEGAVSTVKFLYKTAEDVEPAASVVAEAAPVESGNFFVRLWKKFLALFKF